MIRFSSGLLFALAAAPALHRFGAAIVLLLASPVIALEGDPASTT
jgi:hypothetical protein